MAYIPEGPDPVKRAIKRKQTAADCKVADGVDKPEEEEASVRRSVNQAHLVIISEDESAMRYLYC